MPGGTFGYVGGVFWTECTDKRRPQYGFALKKFLLVVLSTIAGLGGGIIVGAAAAMLIALPMELSALPLRLTDADMALIASVISGGTMGLIAGSIIGAITGVLYLLGGRHLVWCAVPGLLVGGTCGHNLNSAPFIHSSTPGWYVEMVSIVAAVACAIGVRWALLRVDNE